MQREGQTILFMQQHSSGALQAQGFRPGQAAHNAARAAELYGQRSYPEHQSINADVDHDGDEDTTGIRILPLAPVGGLSLATGVSADLELKPLKLFKGLNFVGAGSASDDALIITSFFVGQTDFFVSKGAMAFSGLVSNKQENLLDLPWAGPGLSIYLSIKNISSGTIVVYQSIRGLAVIG
jgi:hypothetical protein